MKIFGSIQELVELVYRIGSNTVTLKPNASQANTVSFQLPNVTASSDTVVSVNSTATLKNKTINAASGVDGNSIINLDISSLLPVAGDATKVLIRDASGNVISSKISNSNIDAVAQIALSKLFPLTSLRALQSDASGVISASSITTTELGHLSGVTSNIQTQLNSKEGTITILPISKGGTNSNVSLNNNRVMISSGSAIVEASALTASRALASDASGLPVASATTSTELGYLSGVTSAVQTQINAKADTSTLTAHTGASSGVHGVTGSVVGTTDTQALTNKDIDGGTASNTNRVTIPKATKSVLDGLTRKQATLLYGTDTNKMYADDGSTLKEIGSGSSGINYLSSQYGADSLGTVQTSVGNVLASSTRSNPSQWGNSAASALITQSTDSTLRGTTNYLVAYTANAQFVESPLFNIDGEDLGKPLLVQFDVSGVGTADDVQVYIARYNSSNVLQERILVAGTASATTPNSAQVPTGVSTFRGFFIPSSTATDKYAIRWLRNANNTSMRLDTFFVGPQSLAQGAVVTAWQDYTPTISNITTGNGTVSAKWRRVGTNLEARIQFDSGTTSTFSNTDWTFSIPTGLTIDSSIDSGNVGFYSFGVASGRFNDGNDGEWRSGLVGKNNSTSVKVFITPNGTNYSAYSWKQSTTGVVNNLASTSFSLYFTVPVAEWSSGTTTLADRAVEEYAWNSDTSAANSPTQFSYGTDGVLIPNITSTGTTYAKRVRFQTPILPTDSIIVEYQQAGSGPWRNVANRMPYTGAGAATYGIQVVNVSSTDIDVNFQAQGAAQTGATYGSSGELWSSYYAAGWKWRVRKVSSGAAVGFPVSARNIVGDTSGTAVPAGYVGETISLTGSVSVPSNTNNTLLVSSQTPSVGVYLMVGSVLFSHAGSVTVANYPLASIIDTQGAGTTVATTTQIPSKPALANAELSLAFSFIFNATGSNKPTFRIESFAGIGCTCSFLNARLIRIA